MSATLPPDLSARRVISEGQAATFCGLSTKTMRRMRQVGTGPTAVMLSSRRLGYRIDTLDTWLGTREAKVAA